MSETQLHVLTPGHDLVQYRLGDELDPLPDDELARHEEPLDGATADLDALRRALAVLVAGYDQYDESVSADAAIAVRTHLDITRQQASVPELWHWLCIVQFPEFVRHRWGPQHDLEEKFLAAGSDIYSNALHRLWWMAELTRDGDDYSRTRRVLEDGGQQVANRLFDHSFARDEALLTAVADVLHGEDLDVVDEFVATFRRRETNYSTETMSSDEVSALVGDVLREVKSGVV